MEDERGLAAQPATVDPEYDIGIEHLDQRVEVAVARGGEECVDDPSLALQVSVLT